MSVKNIDFVPFTVLILVTWTIETFSSLGSL